MIKLIINSCTRDIANNTENAVVWSLKPDWWEGGNLRWWWWWWWWW